MIETFMTFTLASSRAAASRPAQAAVIGLPTGRRARVASDIARTRQRNDAAIAPVRNSIAPTRRNQFSTA